MKFTQIVLAFAFVAMSVAFAHPASGADRSQAGPQASAVTVPPRPTPTIPEGNAGLAAKYPGDLVPQTRIPFRYAASRSGMRFSRQVRGRVSTGLEVGRPVYVQFIGFAKVSLK